MSLAQAIAYFLREASLSLVRSWKVSLLAILTISVSLFLGGVFLLVSGNLERLISRWNAESKVVVYLESKIDAAARARVRELLAAAPWAAQVSAVSTEEARARFREAFPSLSDLLDGWGEEPLPASLEVSLDPARLDDAAFVTWLDGVRADPAVLMVDDDRDWLAQLAAVILVMKGLGMVLGAILLATAIFTISSVIRLTAYLYRDEIAVMRLVGATEFLIRGPFYTEGILQGLAGGVLAVVALSGGYRLVVEESSGSVLAALLTAGFLGLDKLLALIGLGGLAGLIGAVASLRKEDLGQTAEHPDWAEE